MRKNSPARLKTSSLLLVCVVLAACTTSNRPDLGGMSFSSDPLLGKIVWHDLVTEDLDAVSNFYTGLFGWTFEASSGARGENYLLARKDGILVAGVLQFDAPDDGHSYSRWLPYFSVSDVDAALTRTTDMGGTVVAGARDVALGRVAAIIDPQGAVAGLARSRIGDPDDVTTAPGPGKAVWTELLADDPRAAAVFYGALANYQTRLIERRGGEFIYLTADGVDRASIFENPAAGNYDPVWLTAFGVDDPAAAAATAEALGGKIILPVSPELRDGTMAVVTDPSGAILVLQAWMTGGA